MTSLRWLQGWILLLGWLQIAPVHAAVRAWLDREQVALGETVTLNVEVEGRSSSQPDFSVLEQDFEIVGSSSNSQIAIVNGRQSARTLWAVALEPRREGVITIPALEVGNETSAPVLLTVTPAPTNSAAAGGDLFIEVEAEPRTPYVQQQVRYTIRFFYAVALEGSLDEPTLDGARLLRLGGDINYQVERGGRRYQVVERRFALVPERSGTVEIPAPRFRGRGGDATGLGGMFGGGRRLSAVGSAITLDVQPRPAAATSPWLPAQSLQLSIVGDALPSQGQVGEPLSLAVRLAAVGLAAEQLPALTLPKIDGARVYPDQESSRNRDSNTDLLGERERRFAIVPQRSGKLRIPELRIEWWNITSDRAEHAVLPALEIDIAPAEGTVSTSPAVDAATTPAAAAPAADPDVADGAQPASLTGYGPWPWLAAAFALAWLVTLAWAWRLRRGAPSTPVAEPALQPPPPSFHQRRLRDALAGDDLGAIAQALRAMAPTGVGPGLDAIAARLDAQQAESVRQLERCLYAADDDQASCLAALRRAFAHEPRWLSEATPAGTRHTLPDLYG